MKKSINVCNITNNNLNELANFKISEFNEKDPNSHQTPISMLYVSIISINLNIAKLWLIAFILEVYDLVMFITAIISSIYNIWYVVALCLAITIGGLYAYFVILGLNFIMHMNKSRRWFMFVYIMGLCMSLSIHFSSWCYGINHTVESFLGASTVMFHFFIHLYESYRGQIYKSTNN